MLSLTANMTIVSRATTLVSEARSYTVEPSGSCGSSAPNCPVPYTKRSPLCVTASTAPGAAPAATAESRNCMAGCQLVFSAGTGVGGVGGLPGALGASAAATIANEIQPRLTAPAAECPSPEGN